MRFTREPDLVMSAGKGADRVIIDMHFGGSFRPFRAIVRTDRENAMRDTARIMQEQAKALSLWDGQGPWQDTAIAGLMRDAMRHVGEPQELLSFEYGVSLALCVRAC